MLVLVSFVLVLAAAVTLVVGLLQSGLTLIYLSIGCSVLAGVVLAVAVLRGRPEPKAAAPIGRAYTPPVSAPPAPATTSTYEPASTSTYQPPPPATSTYTPPTPPPPPPPRPAPVAPAAAGDDAAIKAAGTALLGRLRRSRGEEPEPEAAFAAGAGPATTEMQVVSEESGDGFPIDNYDSLRATDLLRRLGPLDRNQLEAVRARETAGKNRFTILSRVDTLLAAKEEPAWEVEEDDWEPEADAGPIAVGGVGDDEDEDFDDVVGEMEDDEADEVDEDESVFAVGPASGDGWDDEDEDEAFDELVSPVEAFPIAGYDSLTVGQILPRLSELDADELAQVRTREADGRARGTILDRVDRLAAKSSVTRSAPPARRAPAPAPAPRKARAAKAAAPPPPVAPARKRAAKKAAPAPEPVAPAPRKARATRAAAVPVPPATTTSPAKAAAKKKATTPRKAGGARKVTPPTEAEVSTPMKAAVKKARASKKRS